MPLVLVVRGASSHKRMNLSQYGSVTMSLTVATSALMKEIYRQPVLLFYTLLKKGHAAVIFLLDQFLYQLYVGTWLIRRHAFWEQFQAGVHLKSFSIDNNCVVTPQCSSHSWEGLNPAHNSLYFFGLQQKSHCVAFICSTPYMQCTFASQK